MFVAGEDRQRQSGGDWRMRIRREKKKIYLIEGDEE